MKILASFKTGIIRSLKSWKGIAIVWLFSVLMVSLVAIPMKSALITGLGTSMITEKLANGFNIEVFADLRAYFRSLISYFSSGLFMAFIAGFLINSFLSGGLFNSLKGLNGTFSSGEFFRASAKNFWSFIVILLIISLVIIFLTLLIIVLPVSIVAQAEGSAEGAVFKAVIIAASFFLLILSLLLLVADYARAWQVTREKNECFKALSFGFRQTFRTFSTSYPIMLILVIIHLFYGWLVLSVLAGFKPVTESGIIMLFILSQFLFFLKIMLKAWRYGSVTKMMEITVHPIILRTASPDLLE